MVIIKHRNPDIGLQAIFINLIGRFDVLLSDNNNNNNNSSHSISPSLVGEKKKELLVFCGK